MNGAGIEAGHYVLFPIRVVEVCESGNQFLTRSYNGKMVFTSFEDCYPMPREDEHTITAAELRDICELYAAACVVIPWFGDEEAQLEWVKNRLHDLKQRKEAKA